MTAELEGVTPEEALAMQHSPNKLDAWMERVGLRKAPPGFFGELASLAWIAEEAREAAVLDRHEAARSSAANRRRRDVERLKQFFAATNGGLPPRQKQVFVLCIEEGLSATEAGERLEISRETVRMHLRRLRAVARRNAHVHHSPP